jgi:FHS family L-fucose permease-like MFS transporter
MNSAVLTTTKAHAGRATAFAVAAGLFAIWGLALWLYNALFFRFSLFFGFGPVHVAWTLALFHVAYFFLAIPAAVFNRQFGYKLGFLFGLSVFALAAFLLYLAIIQNSTACFLGAVVMMGSCGAWLDTCLNPLAMEAGNPQTAVARLNAAHMFNGFGLFAGYVAAIWLIEAHYQLSVGATAHLSARPYVLVGLGALMLAFLVEQISLPTFASSRSGKVSEVRGDLRSLLKDRNLQIAAASLCAYTVVLTILWTSNYNYRVHEMPGYDLPGHSVSLIERGFFWFAAGRCIGAALMRWIEPVRLLQWSTGLCLIAIAVTAAVGGAVGWVTLLSASLFLSIAYPTVFGSAVCRQGHQMKLAAGVLATAAGIGNALSCLLVALALHDLHINARIVIALALPFLAVILWYSLTSRPAADPAP